jgi:hypothetical protein
MQLASNLSGLHSRYISPILMPLCSESDSELNRKVAENFLNFAMVIFTPWYDQRFRSYDFWKLVGLLKFCSGHNWPLCEIWTFDPNWMPSQEALNTNIVTNFLSFPMATHMAQSDKWFRSYDHWNLSVVAGNFWFRLNEVSYRLWNLSLLELRSEETLIIKVVGNFISFLKSVEI